MSEIFIRFISVLGIAYLITFCIIIPTSGIIKLYKFLKTRKRPRLFLIKNEDA